MNEPAKENPKTPKRSKRRPAMEPLGWDEIVSQPGMGGYLSFLNGPLPLPHLQRSQPVPDPGAESHSEANRNTVPKPLAESAASPAVLTGPQLDTIVSPDETAPEVLSDPGPVFAPAPVTTSGPAQPLKLKTPEVVSIPAVPRQRLRIRRCAATHDGHSLGEEVLYQALWKAAAAESAEIRTVVIGWRGMSQLCRMTPKNCKINTQRLIRKLALEILSPYNTPESIGTTYRVYSDQAILQRRREAGLEWVVRSRGVEFVDPATGISVLPICAPTY